MSDREPSGNGEEPEQPGQPSTMRASLNARLAAFEMADSLKALNLSKGTPERVVHAKGAGAHGVFEATLDCREWTMAPLFQEVGRKFPCFVRFSTVIGERGSMDNVRDARGFAINFFVPSGKAHGWQYDLLCSSLPVFFVNDPAKFPEFIEAIGRSPKSNLRDYRSAWKFFASTPESLLALIILHTNEVGTPLNYRMMNAYSVHAFAWINEDGKRRWVRYKLASKAVYSALPPPDETRTHVASARLAQRSHPHGASGWPRGYSSARSLPAPLVDPTNNVGITGARDRHIDLDADARDLYQFIDAANSDMYVKQEKVAANIRPRWDLEVQIMDDDVAGRWPWTFDATKWWGFADDSDVKGIKSKTIGTITLDRNPEDYLVEVERATFNPGNLIPGIGLSPDPLLIGRAFAYPDAQRVRLGNFVDLAKTSLAANYIRFPEGYRAFADLPEHELKRESLRQAGEFLTRLKVAHDQSPYDRLVQNVVLSLMLTDDSDVQEQFLKLLQEAFPPFEERVRAGLHGQSHAG